MQPRLLVEPSNPSNSAVYLPAGQVVLVGFSFGADVGAEDGVCETAETVGVVVGEAVFCDSSSRMGVGVGTRMGVSSDICFGIKHPNACAAVRWFT